MTPPVLPSLFVSHGAPTLPFEDVPARDFLAGLAARLPRPAAILAVTAHWCTGTPATGTVDQPETIHDFFGFPQVLYELTYPAPGAPDVGERAVTLLTEAGIPAQADPQRGLDHGTWSPLSLIYPDADIPVTQLSVQPGADAAHHIAVGRALAPLRRDGVLVLASGGAVHNLTEFRNGIFETPAWAAAFDTWLIDAVGRGDTAALENWRDQAPEPDRAHPSDEHLLPLFVAYGASGGRPGTTLHRSFTYGSLSMAAFAFS
jgi:4,5-DOPA dioxygenase extradiol